MVKMLSTKNRTYRTFNKRYLILVSCCYRGQKWKMQMIDGRREKLASRKEKWKDRRTLKGEVRQQQSKNVSRELY